MFIIKALLRNVNTEGLCLEINIFAEKYTKDRAQNCKKLFCDRQKKYLVHGHEFRRAMKLSPSLFSADRITVHR